MKTTGLDKEAIARCMIFAISTDKFESNIDMYSKI